MSKIQCPVCREVGECPVTRSNAGKSVKYITRVRQCKSCGCTFTTEERATGIKRPKDKSCDTCIGYREECERAGGCLGYEQA